MLCSHPVRITLITALQLSLPSKLLKGFVLNSVSVATFNDKDRFLTDDHKILYFKSQQLLLFFSPLYALAVYLRTKKAQHWL